MSPHHQLRSRVVHQRFVAAAAVANALALVVTGFTPKGTEAATILPYVMAINAIVLSAGIIITIVRRNVHRHRASGILIDLLFAILVPLVFLMATGGAITFMKSESAADVSKPLAPTAPTRRSPSSR
jgi:hypothetical protein